MIGPRVVAHGRGARDVPRDQFSGAAGTNAGDAPVHDAAPSSVSIAFSRLSPEQRDQVNAENRSLRAIPLGFKRFA